MTRRALVLARGELLLLARSRLAWLALATLLALSTLAAVTSWVHVESERAERAAHQRAIDELFVAQPDRHPHRVVHYGTYAFRPPGALAAFDPGIDPFTGTTLFLEGHRQNSATFGAVRESSSLVRFGQPTPAFVLQTLAPLLLVFLGFPMVAREREQGTLAQLLAHGASAGEILLGKGLALAAAAGVALSPVLLALAALAVAAPGEALAAALLAVAALAYLLVWVALVVAVSALVRSGRAALTGLVGAWVVAAVLVPRLAAEWAGQSVPLPSRAETDLVLQAELRELGDSHDADDPFFVAFRERTLAHHGVERIEDLPVNYRGLVSAEGESLTARLFDAHAARHAAALRAQVRRLERAQLASPALALRRATLVAAGTDLESHLAFLAQAESHRYAMIQRLNHVHAEQVEFRYDVARSRDAEAERRARVSRENWARIPDFVHVAPTAGERVARASGPLLALLGWLAVALAAAAFAARRLAGSAR